MDTTARRWNSDEALGEHWVDMAFFEMPYSDLGLEIWKFDVCDRMMVFDPPGDHVTLSLIHI